MAKSIEIDELLVQRLTELQKLNPKLKGYNTTELIHDLLREAIEREINNAQRTGEKIDLLDGNMEKLIEGKEKNIDKLNILETKA